LRALKLILITILFSSCQINDKDKEQTISDYSEYTIDEIEFMMHKIYAKKLASGKKESLKLAYEIKSLLKGTPDIENCISLIKKAIESGLFKKELKLTVKQEENLKQQILDAENMSNKFKQLKEIRLHINNLLHIRGLRLDMPRIVLKYQDTLELKPNQKYKFPIEIIHKQVGGSLYKNIENIKEVEIVTGEATDYIEERVIRINVQNQITNEVFGLDKKLYLKVKEND